MANRSNNPTLTQCKPSILKPSDYSLWDELVSRSPHGTVFHYSWWLEASGCEFQILGYRDSEGRLQAGIPLPRRKRGSLVLFHSPNLLTPYLGPVFGFSPTMKENTKLGMMRNVGEKLALAIQGFDSFNYSLGPAAPDLQGFLWAGFQAELYYTFVIDSGTPPEGVLARRSDGHRGHISKAERLGIQVEVRDNLDAFLDLHRKTFNHQGLEMPYDDSLIGRLFLAAKARGCAKIYFATEPGGGHVAGLLVVSDARTCYQLAVGTDHARGSSGGGNLAEWRAIRDALESGRAYDFEGSALRGVERHYRSWGARTRPCWRLRNWGSLRGFLASCFLEWRAKKKLLTMGAADLTLRNGMDE